MARAIPHRMDRNTAPFPVRQCAHRLTDMIVATLEVAPSSKRSTIRRPITAKNIP
jgi:hypothetical protein